VIVADDLEAPRLAVVAAGRPSGEIENVKDQAHEVSCRARATTAVGTRDLSIRASRIPRTGCGDHESGRAS